MTKLVIKTGMLLALLTMAFSFSSGANAAAFHGTPPVCTTSSPGSGEAFVYTGTSYGGTCYVLNNNLLNNSNAFNDLWTSWDATTGFPNDKIQSVWVGPDVTLVLFWNTLNAKDNAVPLHFGPGQFSANLGNWNRQASAARVQNFAFGSCGNQGYISLFTDANFNGAGLNDCIQLAPRNYGSPIDMGFRNDTVTSLINYTDINFVFSNNDSCAFGIGNCSLVYWVNPQTPIANVGSSFNDSLSEIQLRLNP